MSERDEFTIHLVSSASQDDFPANVKSEFITELPRPIHLNENHWKVSCPLISFGHDIINVELDKDEEKKTGSRKTALQESLAFEWTPFVAKGTKLYNYGPIQSQIQDFTAPMDNLSLANKINDHLTSVYTPVYAPLQSYLPTWYLHVVMPVPEEIDSPAFPARMAWGHNIGHLLPFFTTVEDILTYMNMALKLTVEKTRGDPPPPPQFYLDEDRHLCISTDLNSPCSAVILNTGPFITMEDPEHRLDVLLGLISLEDVKRAVTVQHRIECRSHGAEEDTPTYRSPYPIAERIPPYFWYEKEMAKASRIQLDYRVVIPREHDDDGYDDSMAGDNVDGGADDYEVKEGSVKRDIAKLLVSEIELESVCRALTPVRKYLSFKRQREGHLALVPGKEGVGFEITYRFPWNPRLLKLWGVDMDRIRTDTDHVFFDVVEDSNEQVLYMVVTIRKMTQEPSDIVRFHHPFGDKYLLTTQPLSDCVRCVAKYPNFLQFVLDEDQALKYGLYGIGVAPMKQLTHPDLMPMVFGNSSAKQIKVLSNLKHREKVIHPESAITPGEEEGAAVQMFTTGVYDLSGDWRPLSAMFFNDPQCQVDYKTRFDLINDPLMIEGKQSLAMLRLGSYLEGEMYTVYKKAESLKGPGCYLKPQQVIDELYAMFDDVVLTDPRTGVQHAVPLKDRFQITFSEALRTFVFSIRQVANGSIWSHVHYISLMLSPKLCELLGFDDKQMFHLELLDQQPQPQDYPQEGWFEDRLSCPFPLAKEVPDRLTSPLAVHLTRGVDNIYVYTDIIEPHIVGNQQLPVLCIAALGGTDVGEYVTREPPEPPEFMVTVQELKRIHIKLADYEGNRIKFMDGPQPVIIRLHFSRL